MLAFAKSARPRPNLQRRVGWRGMKSPRFGCQHHLVNRGRADGEILPHVGFGRRPEVQARVEVDKRQILALLGGEGFGGRRTLTIRFSCSSCLTMRRHGLIYGIEPN